MTNSKALIRSWRTLKDNYGKEFSFLLYIGRAICHFRHRRKNAQRETQKEALRGEPGHLSENKTEPGSIRTCKFGGAKFQISKWDRPRKEDGFIKEL